MSNDSNSSVPRPHIPQPMKREIRQRCGFGCVFCGYPLYEYHHLLGYSVVQEHKADDITLLCNRHHGEVTKGLISTQQVSTANLKPYSRSHDMSAAMYLYYEGNVCDIRFGSLQMLALGENVEIRAIVIDDVSMLSVRFEDGHALLSFLIKDDMGRRCIEVEDNELVYSTHLWDVEFVANVLTVRRNFGDVFLRVQFEPPLYLHFERAIFVHNRVVCIIDRKGFTCSNGGFAFSNITLEMGTGPVIPNMRANGAVLKSLLDKGTILAIGHWTGIAMFGQPLGDKARFGAIALHSAVEKALRNEVN